MSMRICVLASGSAGNCTVVRTSAGVFLIDCGIGPRTVHARLRGTGVDITDISAICLTHLDRDHFNLNWMPTVLQRGIRIFCSRGQVHRLCELVGDDGFAALVCPFDNQQFEIFDGLAATATRLAHDEAGSSAFLFEGFGTRLGHATDLGRVPIELIERFCGVDLLAIESNYDPDLQMNSPRPGFLKHRIMGGKGHLSNAQALAAVKAILDRCERRGDRLPERIVLLHRSRECNCPKLVRELFSRDGRIAPRLVLTEQHRRTEWVGTAERVYAGEQLTWAWG